MVYSFCVGGSKIGVKGKKKNEKNPLTKSKENDIIDLQ